MPSDSYFGPAGLALKLAKALENAGMSPREINSLSEDKETLDDLVAVHRGEKKIVPVSAVIASIKLAINKTFNPAEFFGEGWKFDPTQPRGKSVSIKEIDPSEVILTQPAVDGEVIKDEEYLARIKGDGKIHLGADHFLAFWENRQFLPEEWRKYVITFDDDTLLDPSGVHCVLYLCWSSSDGWYWACRLLGRCFSCRYRSAALAA